MATDVVEAADSDVLAYMNLPQECWTRIYSTKPLERVNKEVKRRKNAVGIFPNEASVIRMVGSNLMEISDEWQVGWRYFSTSSRRSFGEDSMKKLLDLEPQLLAEPDSLRLAPVG